MNSFSRGATIRNLVTIVLLFGALVLIAMASSDGTRDQLAKLPQLVHDKVRFLAGAI